MKLTSSTWGRNMVEVGQLDEITVFPILIDNSLWTGFFDLHDGERRWRAAQLTNQPTLRAKIVPRPSSEELTFKKVSRILQTRSLSPETKLDGVEEILRLTWVFSKALTNGIHLGISLAVDQIGPNL